MFRIEQCVERDDELLIRLKSVERGPPVLVVVARAAMREKEVTIEDVKETPTLVLPRDRKSSGETEVSFMSARLQAVVVLTAAVRRS